MFSVVKLAAALCCLLATLVAGQIDCDGIGDIKADKSLLGRSYRSFFQALKNTGLLDELADFKGTVLAPTNLAMDRFLKKAGLKSLKGLKKNKLAQSIVKDVLLAHFLEGMPRDLMSFGVDEETFTPLAFDSTESLCVGVDDIIDDVTIGPRTNQKLRLVAGNGRNVKVPGSDHLVCNNVVVHGVNFVLPPCPNYLKQAKKLLKPPAP